MAELTSAQNTSTTITNTQQTSVPATSQTWHYYYDKSGIQQKYFGTQSLADSWASSQGYSTSKPTSTPTSALPTSTYTGSSIVDYLKSTNQASDFTSRSKLASQYGITNYTGTASQNTELLNYLKTGTTVPSSVITETPAETTTSLEKSYITQPELPEFDSIQTNESLVSGLLAELQRNKEALTSAYDLQISNTQNKINNAQAKIDSIIAKEQGTLEEVNQLTQPFRAELETAERERLKIEENFFANQALTEELESLLDEGNALIKQQKEATGLSAIRTDRVNQTISDVNARAGVIEATINARNNQITLAENLIDRTANAIAADKQDRLSYYNSILGFYDNLRTTEEGKLVALNSEERAYINAKINMLENDLEQSQATIQQVKNAMTNPATALIYAQAGVSLNDSVEEINIKLANYTYKQEVSNTSNSLYSEGYSYLMDSQIATLDPEEYIEIVDSAGNKTYWKKPTGNVSTQVVEVNGRKKLINTQTGEVIADLGVSDTTGGDTGGGSYIPGEIDSTSASILSQTGLSLLAFKFLTTGTTALTRLTASARTAVMKEAEQWANQRGVDISTFQSQYKAYNDVVERYINIGAKTKLAGNDILSSLEALDKITKDQGLTNVRIANVAKEWVGKETNDKDAAKYAYNLIDLKTAIASLFAFQGGKNMIDNADQEQASEVIKNGLATGTIEGLKETVKYAVDKYAGLATESVDNAQKAIWDLFGVGSNYVSKITQAGTDSNTSEFKSSSGAVYTGLPTEQTTNNNKTKEKPKSLLGKVVSWVSNLF